MGTLRNPASGTTSGPTDELGAAQRWGESLPGEAAYSALVGNVTDYAIFLMDRDGTIRSWNAGAQAVYGHTAAEIVGAHFSVLHTPEEVARGYPELSLQNAARLGRSEDEGWRLRKNGKTFWARVVVHALRDGDGTLYGYGEIARDLTDERRRTETLRRAEQRSATLHELAMRDPLTGAFNRRHLADFLRGATERAAWTMASLLAIDVDNFKLVNDRHGHDAGDTVLVAIARLVGSMLRGDDRLFRIGGDEFLVYLPGAMLGEARMIAERLRQAVASAPMGNLAPVTVSIGTAQLTTEDTVESWVQRADAAMYDAKHQGRNRVG